MKHCKPIFALDVGGAIPEQHQGCIIVAGDACLECGNTDEDLGVVVLDGCQIAFSWSSKHRQKLRTFRSSLLESDKVAASGVLILLRTWHPHRQFGICSVVFGRIATEYMYQEDTVLSLQCLGILSGCLETLFSRESSQVTAGKE